MTAQELLQKSNADLTTALLRKEQLAGELEDVNLRIRALRNFLEGARTGAEALREEVQRVAAEQKGGEVPSPPGAT